MINQIDEKLNKKDYLVLILKGFYMGIANAIPGISGGTIAFIVGIYEDLINSIKSFDLKFIKSIFKLKLKEAFSLIPWRFLLALFVGTFIAIISLSKIITWLLINKPVLINSFFFGLILATIPIMGKVIKKWNMQTIILLIFSCAGTYYFVSLVPVSTPETYWFVLISGALAISTMILPGISGAFVLVLLGKYQYILEAINNRSLDILSFFCLGMIIGILTFVRILSWLFKNYHDATVAILTGIVVGSLRKIWPWKRTLETMVSSRGEIIPVSEINILPKDINIQFISAIFIMIIGFFCAIVLNINGKDKIL